MICPYCDTKVHPSKPAKLYKCGNCGKIFRAPSMNHFDIQRMIMQRAQEWLEELEQYALAGLPVSSVTLSEARNRLERYKL